MELTIKQFKQVKHRVAVHVEVVCKSKSWVSI